MARTKEAPPRLSDHNRQFVDALENYMFCAGKLYIAAQTAVEIMGDLDMPGMKPLRERLQQAISEFDAAR